MDGNFLLVWVENSWNWCGWISWNWCGWKFPGVTSVGEKPLGLTCRRKVSRNCFALVGSEGVTTECRAKLREGGAGEGLLSLMRADEGRVGTTLYNGVYPPPPPWGVFKNSTSPQQEHCQCRKAWHWKYLVERCPKTKYSSTAVFVAE